MSQVTDSDTQIQIQEYEVQENYQLDEYDHYNDRFNKPTGCKSYRVFKGNVPASVLTYLSKEQDRSSRESKNRGGKTELRRNARLNVILTTPILPDEEPNEETVINNKPARVVLKKVRRKIGHRQGWKKEE